jgi:hypothetical protein
MNENNITSLTICNNTLEANMIDNYEFQITNYEDGLVWNPHPTRVFILGNSGSKAGMTAKAKKADKSRLAPTVQNPKFKIGRKHFG